MKKKILFITSKILTDLHGGAFIYSYYLVKWLMRFCDVTILGYHYNNGSFIKDFGNRQIKVYNNKKHKIFSFFTLYPNTIFQNKNRSMKNTCKKLIINNYFDAIVIDHFRMSWLIPVIFKYSNKKKCKTVFITHNHETTARKTFYKNENNLIKKLAYWIDCEKIKIFENRSFKRSDIITANNESDKKSIKRYINKNVTIITPGYDGDKEINRKLNSGIDRDVLFLGSFSYEAKKINLDKFLKSTDDLFYDNKINVKIVGRGEDTFYNYLKSKYRSVNIIGEKENVEKYLLNSRIGILSEPCGGGFKLKSLDYIFHKLPLFVLKGSIIGLPIKKDKDYLEFGNIFDLANGVVEFIDDFNQLNKLADNAYKKCDGKFKWSDRGKKLYSCIFTS